MDKFQQLIAGASRGVTRPPKEPVESEAERLYDSIGAILMHLSDYYMVWENYWWHKKEGAKPDTQLRKEYTRNLLIVESKRHAVSYIITQILRLTRHKTPLENILSFFPDHLPEEERGKHELRREWPVL